MVAIPSEGRWILRSLTERDTRAALEFLSRQPLLNVYLISRILDDGLNPSVQAVEVSLGGSIVCIASLTSNLVLAASETIDPVTRSTAMSLIAERILSRNIPVRAMISDSLLVEELWTHLEPRLEPPTVVRLRQPVYAMSTALVPLEDLRHMRFATLRDLEALVPACAAMHAEEVGIDPLTRDPVGYRQRVRELIARGRALLWKEHGRVIFKCEFSAVTPQAVQLMGVWTHPSHRGRGYARRGLREICGHILRQRKQATLFVNDFNDAAIRLYEELGFRRIGENRALIW
jgi:predicted GNAT family acetyltransferase